MGIQTFKAVKETLIKDFGANEEAIISELLLEEEFGLDPEEMVHLMIHLEKLFGIMMDDEKAAEVKTVQNLVGLLDDSLAEKYDFDSWSDLEE